MTRAAQELDTPTSSELVAEPITEPTTEPGSKREQQLAASIAKIKDRARRDPQAYLRDTVVPEGGE